MLEGIEDELDFCCKLAEEESVILLPGERKKKYNLIFIHLFILRDEENPQLVTNN